MESFKQYFNLNERAAKDLSDEASQNIISQLHKAKASMEGGVNIKFKDGESHFISGDHAMKILDKHSDMRPADKLAFQNKIHKSHESFKSEL